MKHLDFIKESVKHIKSAFPNVKAYYGFDEDLDMHLVKIEPISIFDSDEFIEIERKVLSDFFDRYFCEDQFLSFISTNCEVKLEKVLIDFQETINIKPPNRLKFNFKTCYVSTSSDSPNDNITRSFKDHPRTKYNFERNPLSFPNESFKDAA